MAPAGGPDAFDAALRAGADEIYMGVAGYGARQFAQNFSVEQYCRSIETAHLFGAKVNLTFNTLLTDSERESAFPWLNQLYEAGLDAVIVQDWGVADFLFANFPELSVHASTQFSLSTPEECLFMASAGFSRLVLARELSLEEISAIRALLNSRGFPSVELEVFASGALCLCCSGKCYLSSFLGGRSGNRGSCAQPCRLPYTQIAADETADENQNQFFLSLKDQWQETEDVARMVAAGVNVIKLEGRMKSPSYVFQAVQYYRNVIDAISKSEYKSTEYKSTEISPVPTENFEPEIAKTFNRGYAKGYLYSHDPEILNPFFSANWGVSLGRVKNGRVVLDKDVRNGDGIAFLDANYQKLGGSNISRIYQAPHKTVVAQAEAGSTVEFDVPIPARAQYVWRTFDIAFQKSIQKNMEQTRRSVPITAALTALAGRNMALTLSDGKNTVAVESESGLEESLRRPATKESLEQALNRFGESPFVLNRCEITTDGKTFVPASVLNSLRQSAVERLSQIRIQSSRRNAAEEKLWTPPVCAIQKSAPVRFAACVYNSEQAQYCRSKGLIVYPSLPPVRFPSDCFSQIDGANIASHLDRAIQFEKSQTPFTMDWSVNVTNPRALVKLEKQFRFMKTCYISPETLTGAVLPGGIAERESAIQNLSRAASVDLGAVIVGAPRLMYTRKTLFNQDNVDLLNPDKRRLRVIRNGEKPETNGCSGSSVYEIKAVNYLNLADSLIRWGITELRFDFVWHSITEMESWINPILSQR